MTPAETTMVLGAAQAVDLRTVGETDVAAWHGLIGHLPYDMAREAVRAHYASQTRRIMPADLIELVRLARNEAAADSESSHCGRSNCPCTHACDRGYVYVGVDERVTPCRTCKPEAHRASVEARSRQDFQRLLQDRPKTSSPW